MGSISCVHGDRVTALARAIRRHVLRMTHRAGSSHVGSCLSIADLLAVLYGEWLQVDPARPGDPDRDRFILSKGHACAALYAVLAERGFFPIDWLDTFYADGSRLLGHVAHTAAPGIEVSTGSLGHGLALGCGMAMTARIDGRPSRAVVLMSDGECDEGSVWEAALFAAHQRLENLTAVVDCNGLQGLGEIDQVLGLEPFADKWRSFGWGVEEIDGHDCEAIRRTLAAVPFEPGRPTCIIARTVKGKGVSFMENQVPWHYRSPTSDELVVALREIEAAS